jgi:hypothetical protein
MSDDLNEWMLKFTQNNSAKLRRTFPAICIWADIKTHFQEVARRDGWFAAVEIAGVVRLLRSSGDGGAHTEAG